MRKIICNVNLFSMNQNIIYINNDIEECLATTTLSKLPMFIASCCNQKKIYKIHLYGSEAYLCHLTTAIQKYSKENFGINKLEIEVN